MRFRIGQKVICIDDRHPNDGRHYGNGHEKLVRAGVVYTIREIIPAGQSGEKENGLLLEEIVNHVDRYFGGVGEVECELFFRASRFRRRTDIDVFLKMLPTRSPFWAEDVEAEAWRKAFKREIGHAR